MDKERAKKNRKLAWLLWSMGPLGIHRIYWGKWVTGPLQIVLFGMLIYWTATSHLMLVIEQLVISSVDQAAHVLGQRKNIGADIESLTNLAWGWGSLLLWWFADAGLIYFWKQPTGPNQEGIRAK